MTPTVPHTVDAPVNPQHTASMSSDDDKSARQRWLDSLKPGDKVAVFEGYRVHSSRFVHEATIERRTPTGRIVLQCFSFNVYRADGWNHVRSGSTYANRHLRPIDTPRGGS